MNIKRTSGYYNKLGCRYYNNGDFNEAIIAFTEAIAFFDTHISKYLVNRGTANYYNKNDKLALIDFNLAIEAEPHYILAYIKRGNLYLDKNEINKAISDYTQAINLGSLEPEVFVNRAAAYDLLNDSKSAFIDISRAIELFDTPDAHALINRGITYAEWGDWTFANTDFNNALKISFHSGEDIEIIKERISEVYEYYGKKDY